MKRLLSQQTVNLLVEFTPVLETPKPTKRRIGGAKGVTEFMADDFDAPLEDFKDYM